MTQVQYQFTDSSKWELVWSETRQAENVDGDILRYKPIKPFTLGVQFSSPALLIYTNSQSAAPHWKYAATAITKINTGVTISGGVPQTVTTSKKLYLRQNDLMIVPPFASSYSVEINAPWYLEDIEIVVFEYIGDDRHTIPDKLDQILINTTSTP